MSASQTIMATASSTSGVRTIITNESTTMTVMTEPTTAPSTPSDSSTSTVKAQLDENKIDALTTSAKAGIGAGVGVLVLLALLAAFLLLRRRRRQKKIAAPLNVLAPGYEKGEQAELMGSPTPTDAGSKFTMSPMSEMGGGVFQSNKGQENGTVLEVGGSDPVELPASQSYGEMRQTAGESIVSNNRGVGRPQSGPLPSASELYPSPQSRTP